ncbi:MAG: hypothetical protein OXK78_09845 [Caldilineaceae bacterium]|nr:hypothetical protein [Caldilineaceae bacterium]
MKIKNLAGFLLVVILLATGTTPVIAQEVSQCESVEPIRPGDSVTDAVSDVPAAHVDLTAVETSLSGEALTVVFHLRDLPDTLRFNRTEHGKGSKEYEWEVAIDVDNDRGTGPGGYDTLLTAYHIAFMSHEGTDADVTAPIGEMLEAAVWTAHSGGSTSGLADADLAVSAAEDTITITGHIPGITSASRLTFSAYDVEFAGEADQIDCHPSYRESMGPWGCDAGEALTAPGQSATDESEGVTEPHIDITGVDTSLAGETLTAVFHLRDVPEMLTFNRTGASEGYLEYAWVVVVDVDNDRETGSGGFEYQMLASYSVPPSEAESNVKAPIANEVEVSVWSLEPGSAVPAADAALEVSPEEDTLTLSGRIPGITTASRLAFRTYDFAGGLDEIGCFTSQSQSQISYPGECDTDEAVAPGQTLVDETADVQAAHIDITEVETSLSGETLTVVFHLRDIPETLTFNRTGISERYGEYSWNVSIDVDGDRETGYGGIEYELSASHFVRSSEKGRNEKASIESGVEAGVLKARGDGFMSMGAATLEVSPQENTLTLSGTIPGITAESQLTFSAYDYFSGFDRIGCPAGPVLGAPASQDVPASRDAAPSLCTDDEPAVTPGQTATDDLSDVSAAYLDIAKVSATLSGEMLTVMLRFRDIPETLTFNRTGTRANSMEYMWEVSVDADGDPETGDNGFEYLLSAHHIVRPDQEGDNTEAPIEEVVKASVWEKRPGGGISSFRSASLDVSAETDTMILRGRIPGITPASRLSFRTHGYRGETDELGCQALPVTAAPSGRTASTDQSREPAGHVDIRGVTTTVDGETLTVTLLLRDLPETLTFDRTGVPAHALEYAWEVSVDADSDAQTGAGGFDYMLSAGYVVHPLVKDANTAAKITDPGYVTAGILGLDAAGNRVVAGAAVEVSAAGNTITLSGDIPGITAASPLRVRAYDYFGGWVEMAGSGTDRCRFDSAAITPGQRVVAAVSEALPAYMDITQVSTALTDGGKLTVVFHLRDIPETLEFNRKNISKNTLEYRWEVLVDVVDDRETGKQGADYTLSASHFVFSPSSGDGGVHRPIEDAVQADTWKMNPDGLGAAQLSRAAIEVSPAENTITLIGEIPGITAASRLEFEAYDFLHGSEQVACQVLSIVGDSE